MIEKIADLVNADARLSSVANYVDTTFMIAIDNADTLIRIQEGRVTKVTPGVPFITPDYSFALRAPRDVLGEILAAAAAARLHRHVRAGKQKLMRVEGDLHPFMANLLYFKDVIAAPRRGAAK